MFCCPISDHVMVPQRTVFFSNVVLCTWMHVHMYVKRKKEDFPENITWSEIGSQNIKHKKREPAEKYKMATTKR